MRQVTLVMLYGPKPSNVSGLIAECQERLRRRFGECFEPYDLRQVHATLVGLERVSASAMNNLYLEKYRRQQKPMDFAGLLNFLRTGGRFPFQVQIGGFQQRDYPFVSQGNRPYERSFSLQNIAASLPGETAVALMMGWPLRGEPGGTIGTNALHFIQEARIYPTVLDEFRQSVQCFNILHRYHAQLAAVDNDLYFRIGLLRRSPPDYLLREEVERGMRDFLSRMKPTIIEISLADVYLASYMDETLPLGSTEVCSINESGVTPEFICSLYK
jgi:hypothetical protein